MHEIPVFFLVLSAFVFSGELAILDTDANTLAEIESVYYSDTDTLPIVFHENQYFVELDSIIIEDTIASLLAGLNSREVWYEDDLNLAVWEVISFPFTAPNGDLILDINDAITSAKKKTQIRSSTLDVQSVLASDYLANEPICFDISQYFVSQGDESIKISILDTGISDISDNSTTDYNYNLSSYSGYDYVNNDSIPEDEHGHGSHIAGLIHSITHQSFPLNPRITYDIRKTHDAFGQAYMSSVVFALIEAIKANADIVNMSFSVNDVYHDSLFFPLENVIAEAEKEGVLVIAAAGNDSLNNDDAFNTALPASFPANNIISVTSSGCLNDLSLFSNFGPHSVDLVTLGEHIPGPDLDKGISYLSGTSQAAAIITALAALKGSQQVVFDYKLIKCAMLNSATHYVELTDKVRSDGVFDLQNFFNSTIVDCNDIVNNCNENFIGENSLVSEQNENVIVETQLNIESSQILNSLLHMTYDAKISTALREGFEIKAGGVFQITNDGCEN